MASWQNRIVRYTEEVPDQLMANARNWRIHPKAQSQALLGALDDLGWIMPVICNEVSGAVIDGHLRVSLALRRNEPMIPVAWVRLTEQEEIEALATIDPLTAMAVADKEKLSALLHDVSTGDAALQQMLAELAKDAGITPSGNGREAPDPQIERVAELQAKWGTQLGQLWEIPSKTVPGKAHRLLCGDSTKPEDVACFLEHVTLEAICTDPPFAITGSATGSEDMSGLSIILPFFRLWMQEWFRWLPEFAHVYICCDWRTFALIDTEAKQHRAVPKNCVVWDKGGGGLGSFYQNSHEFIWFGVIQAPRHIKANKTGQHIITGQSNIWRYNPSTYGGGLQSLHTANKPVELFARMIENSTDRGGCCGDPFVGAGTSLLACESVGRLSYGCELEPKYVALTLERMYEFTGELPKVVPSIGIESDED